MEANLASQTRTLQEFFEYIYGEQEGYCYSPYRDPRIEGDWTQCFFKWPEDKELLIKHITAISSTNDVYYSPALYKSPDATKESFKTTRVVWAEFDGTLPDSLGSIPQPSLKIRSSTEGHEHWYWLLDFELQDPSKVEDITRRLSFALSADHCWNTNRVLRPPGTTHISSSLPVRVLYKTANSATQHKLSPIQLLEILPHLPTALAEFTIGTIPDALDTVAKYKWPLDAWDLFKKQTQPEGSRSSALARLALHCVEMGMNNAEAFAIIATADFKWKKFSSRSDKKERYIALIKYAIAQKLKPSTTSTVAKPKLPIFSFREILEKKEIKIEWVVPDLISTDSGVIIASEGGVGKTQISLQAGIHMALGKDFVGWKIAKHHKVVMFQLEMGEARIKHFMEQMGKGLSSDQIDLLHENLHIIPLGEHLLFDNPETQATIHEVLQYVKPQGIMIDSLGYAIGGNINSDEAVLKLFGFVNSLKNKYKSFVWFVHHTRKPQVGNKRPKDLGDLYGNQYIGAWPDTAFNLWKNSIDEIEFNYSKVRLGPDLPPRYLKRTENLNFIVTRIKDARGKATAAIEASLTDDDFLSFG